MSYFTIGDPSKEHGIKLPTTLSRKSSGKVKRRHHVSHHLPESSLASILTEQCECPQEGLWVEMTGQIQPRNYSHHNKTWDCEPSGRAVLLGSLILLVSAWVPLPNKVSCSAGTCVSWDSSFSMWHKSPLTAPGRGSPFCNNIMF